VTGEHPFLRNSVLETASAILHEAPGGGEEPKTLTDSGPLRQVVLRLLQKDPDLRYQETSSVVEDLRAVSRGEPIARHLPLVRPARRTRNLALGVALAVVAVVAVLLVWQPWAGPESPGLVRPAVAVLPFEDRTGEREGALRGEMIADLISAGLGDSTRLRSLGEERLGPLLAAGLPAPAPGDRARKVLDSTRADCVVEGVLWKEEDTYEASVRIYRAREPEPVGSFKVAAAGTAALADLATVRVLESLFPGENVGKGPDAAEMSSASEEARLLELRARKAFREFRYAEAIEDFEDALEIDPRFLLARVRLARALEAAGYGRRARDEADAALRQLEGPLGAPSPRIELEARASIAGVHDDLGKAIGYHRELVDRYPDEPAQLQGLAQALHAREEGGEEALALLDRALAIDPEAPRLVLSRAPLLEKLGRAEDADRALDRADELLAGLESLPGRANVRELRGDLRFGRGEYDEAGALYLEARDLFAEAGLDARAAVMEKSAGDAELSLGRLEAAGASYEAVLPTLEANGQIGVLIHALNGMASRLYLGGKLAEAEPYYRRAVDAARPLDNPRLSMAPTVNLADLLSYTGRLGEARALAEEALELARQRGHREGEVQAMTLIADADAQQGRLAEAAEAHRSIIEYQRSPSGKGEGLGYQLGCLAEILDLMGGVGEALELVDESVALLREERQRVTLGYVLLRRASLRGQVGRWEEARSDLEESLAIANDEAGALEDLGPRVDLERGRLAEARGDWEEAEGYLARARTSSTGSTAPTLRVPLLVTSCRVALARGRDREALGWCREALAIERATASHRIQARAALARSLSRNGEVSEAERAARQALDEAERVELSLTAARAAAVLLALDEAPLDRDTVRARGLRGLERYIESVPADRRDAVTRRADLEEILRLLEYGEG
jgi:tetratricopeptide (TPR) repeat protein